MILSTWACSLIQEARFLSLSVTPTNLRSMALWANLSLLSTCVVIIRTQLSGKWIDIWLAHKPFFFWMAISWIMRLQTHSTVYHGRGGWHAHYWQSRPLKSKGPQNYNRANEQEDKGQLICSTLKLCEHHLKFDEYTLFTHPLVARTEQRRTNWRNELWPVRQSLRCF